MTEHLFRNRTERSLTREGTEQSFPRGVPCSLPSLGGGNTPRKGDPRESVRGVTVEGLAREALAFTRTRPDLAPAVAFRAWSDVVGLDGRLEREVRDEYARLRAQRRLGRDTQGEVDAQAAEASCSAAAGQDGSGVSR
jgi:hypothetical protein